MKSVNEQFAEMQKKTLESLEPIQNMNAVAAEAFERIARKNYALMGDLVDYAVSQVRMPKPDADIKEIYEQRIADTKAFAEKVNERAAEYVALAGELGEMAQAKTAAKTAAKSAATKSATGTGTAEKNTGSAKAKSTKPAAPKTEAAESAKPATAEQVKSVTAESSKTSTPSATPAKAAEPVAKAAAPKKAATPAKAAASSAKKKASATKKSTAKAK